MPTKKPTAVETDRAEIVLRQAKVSVKHFRDVGKLADLLLVDGQPWTDIRDLKNIKMVILSGRIALDNA